MRMPFVIKGFWSSVDLTGNQTFALTRRDNTPFWSSVDLTGNQTKYYHAAIVLSFWSSVDLTGNQTCVNFSSHHVGFGAVSI